MIYFKINKLVYFFRDNEGSLHRLKKNFVDTGMGLERILSLVQGVSNNYATDLFTPYFEKISKVFVRILDQFSKSFDVSLS